LGESVDNGYKYIPNFLSEDQLITLERVLLDFHRNWLEENREFYEKRAINSAYLTDSNKVSIEDRKVLFDLITSSNLICELKEIFSDELPAFLNTQLFFDPKNSDQKNYWHRDIQYTGLSEDEQKEALTNKPNNVVHFRFALRDEEGIELVPGSNSKWDTEKEYKVRMELDNYKSSDDLDSGQTISLNRGDLLIFSANMIHRGLYGKDRFALDLLYCERDPEILKYRMESCLPNKEELKDLDFKELFYLDENLL
jgi:ectoine hydroxylase-related dioxygenase (phytanoyl-CoA dioxygenase family)